MYIKSVLLVMAIMSGSSLAMASDYEVLQSDWAVANYQTSTNRQSEVFEELAKKAEALVNSHPESAENHIWYGIILSTWAGVDGGLGALSRVKQARRELETALELDPDALQGSAYTSLGALYYQVPGWPLAFGDKKQAEKLLRKALQINPEGIDSNYFMGDYLMREKRYEEARVVLQKALQATPRPDRELADRGRRAEIQALLSKL
jgi:tetratricopeptide (TPR) repeat protein